MPAADDDGVELRFGHAASVLVVLDLAGRTDLGLAGVLSGLAQGAALPQQVPALVERDFEVLQPLVFLVLADLLALELVAQLLLFSDQPVNFGEDVLVFCHTASVPDYGWSGDYKT
ncbi:hypothetical protein MSMEG_5665 [Mycolicibacterium smegmatis MC2 155]|uniref:Uncharacterized protein n=1 Tax=Mycolicibacterium smegmatis (strain ATCC 700084 / mc(2)155) TaxID=246196 RepID=A0R410_MYCS2|nr:hypothetical protein MSMEG_5665 [Mycolicibacterium smegmatis MC2 155]